MTALLNGGVACPNNIHTQNCVEMYVVASKLGTPPNKDNQRVTVVPLHSQHTVQGTACLLCAAIRSDNLTH